VVVSPFENQDMRTHVAIAIVGYNNVADIECCVQALAQSTYPDFEVVICENGGDETYQALQNALATSLAGGQPVRLLKSPANNGYASGINQCIAASPSADAWWVLNPDTEPMPTALAALVERLEQGDVQAVGCTLYFPNGQVQSHGCIWRSWLARAVSIGSGSALETASDIATIEREQNYLSGASMLVSREFVQRAGLMSEEFFLYCEEVDWCLRAAKKGSRVGFAAKAKVLHKQGTSTGRSISVKDRSGLSVYLDERNKILLTKIHFPARLPVASAAALLLIALRYLRKGALRQFSYGVSGWFAGLLGRRGIPGDI
jgi:N-acetylglucosaminyl-diphospho-decaprenol L-rhamnosyltransferase